MQYGRQEIFTDVEEITSENVIGVLRDAMNTHRANADRCNFLIKYEQGEQPLQRVKTYRSDIDIVCLDNICSEIINFKLGFIYGNPITLIQRGEKDTGKENKDEMEGIALLNECYQSQENDRKMQELARYIEICGLGYSFVDINTEWEEGDSYFTVDALDPRNTFVIKSSNLGHKPMLGVTFRQDTMGNTYYTCFSKDNRYEIKNMVKIENGEITRERWSQANRSGERNPLGMIPIIEWVRSADRMGAFERVISACDTLNIMCSDIANLQDQNTQSIWWGNDIEFPTDDNGNLLTPKSNDWLLTKTPRDGKAPSVNPLSTNCDYGGLLSNVAQRRAWILEQCNVPQRNDNSGGSTGVAMDTASGWSSAESSASQQESFLSSAKMQEVKVVLKAIEKSSDIPQDSPMLKLKAMDVKPSIKRQKTYEMVTKINAFATAVTHGLDWKSMVKEINFFQDPQQVIVDSEPTMKKFIESNFKTEKVEEKVNNDGQQNQDESDQIQNSPLIDGMKMENPEGKKEDKNNVDNNAK